MKRQLFAVIAAGFLLSACAGPGQMAAKPDVMPEKEKALLKGVAMSAASMIPGAGLVVGLASMADGLSGGAFASKDADLTEEDVRAIASELTAAEKAALLRELRQEKAAAGRLGKIVNTSAEDVRDIAKDLTEVEKKALVEELQQDAPAAEAAAVGKWVKIKGHHDEAGKWVPARREWRALNSR